jgi:inosine-uridine nucleoside N-ribohydrolase
LSETVPVLLDTDIGSDIDDAVALAYLLSKPECELAGITTVTGDVAKRAALASYLCEVAGRPDIPVHCGASTVLLNGPGQPDVPQYEAIAAKPHRIDWPSNTAIDFMRRTIRERPGEVTLLSIGPVTNVALLFALDPELPSMLKAWVSMAGVFFQERGPEWNARCDPVATAMAFRAHPPRRIHVGLDVTMQCRLDAVEVRARFKGPLLEAVLEMAEPWFAQRPEIVFHDPLATALIFRPELCELRRGLVSVDDRTGQTRFDPDPSGPDEVAAQVDSAAFFAEYFGVFGA